nr:molybdopterin cofactor-binding domain-containing protein [Bradyrhizobium sp. 153]
MCSPSNPCWTRSPPCAARTRSHSVCAICATSAPRTSSAPLRNARRGNRRSESASVTASALRAIRTWEPTAPRLPKSTDDIRVKRLTLAVDVGEAINPDGAINQIEGGAIQATSWVLKERVRFDRVRITSTSWTDYPILRFSEVPAVDVELIQRPEIEPVGAGEAAHGPVTAAIANAVYDCLGVRVRDLPITRDRIIAAAELAS